MNLARYTSGKASNGSGNTRVAISGEYLTWTDCTVSEVMQEQEQDESQWSGSEGPLMGHEGHCFSIGLRELLGQSQGIYAIAPLLLKARHLQFFRERGENGE